MRGSESIVQTYFDHEPPLYQLHSASQGGHDRTPDSCDKVDYHSTSSISSVSKNSLSRNPTTLRTQKFNNGRNILNIRQPIPHRAAPVECHRIRSLLGVEEWGVHWSWGYGVHADHVRCEFFGYATGEVLNWGFGASVGGVEAGEGGEEGCHDCGYFAALGDVLGGLFEYEEGGLGVHSEIKVR